jgi:uncharacterized protein YprB with RNaseH-like and TPR domain
LPNLNQTTKPKNVTTQTQTVSASRGTEAMLHAAESLRVRSQTTKEYQIVTEPPKTQVPTHAGCEGWIYSSEFDLALQLKADLTRKFEGIFLEEALPGKTMSNVQGECYCITQTHDVAFKRTSLEESRQQLIGELQLLSGIGPARAHSLKSQGYCSIEALASHPKWRKSAREFLTLVDSGDVLALQQRLRCSLPKSHPLSHYLAGFCPDEAFAIIDIETLGLFGRPVILIGAANVTQGKLTTNQYLARDVGEEACALQEFTSTLKPNCAFISFNGRCFDVPFMRERIAYYGLDCEAAFGGAHFDVLHFTRRAFKEKLANCRLETVEAHMGIERGINIPGALVPEFYDSYQRSGNVGPLVAIVEHNKQDLVTLAQLFCWLYGEWQ